jgi:hypothetical protein
MLIIRHEESDDPPALLKHMARADGRVKQGTPSRHSIKSQHIDCINMFKQHHAKAIQEQLADITVIFLTPR